MFKTATNTSNAGTLSVYDDIIAKNELEHVLTQNESTVKLKYNEVIPLTEVVDMNKTQFCIDKNISDNFPTKIL